jgi:putative ATP-binding cassette transporter
MSIVGHLFRYAWKSMGLITLASVVAGLAAAALVAVIGRAVVGLPEDRPLLAVAFFSLCAAYAVTKSLSEAGLLRLTQSMIVKLRLSLSRKLLGTPQKRLQGIGQDELMVLLTKDIDTFSSAFQVIPRTLTNLIVVLACLGYMAWLSGLVFLMFSACTFVCVGGYLLVERKSLRQLAKARECAQHLQKAFRSLVSGSRELQLNSVRGRHFVESVLGDASTRHSDLFTAGMTRYTWAGNVGNILFYQGIGVLLFVAPMFLAPHAAVTTKLTLVMLYVIRPIAELMFAAPMLRQAGISFNKVQQLDGRLFEDPAQKVSVDPFGQSVSRLELRSVCHRYATDQADEFCLGPISLEIHSGEILFMIGGNGTGKTTLAMLLLGLHEPESGEVVLNGITVTDANRAYYRQRFSAIFSDGHLFEHVPMGSNPCADADAARYLEALGLPAGVSVKDGKFSTIDLSMGQRKRLALISSYIEDRPIYVFDEWAADQDPVFKRIFYTQIVPDLKARGKAVIIISHDDAYFSYADRTIKLDGGRLQRRETETRNLEVVEVLA